MTTDGVAAQCSGSSPNSRVRDEPQKSSHGILKAGQGIAIHMYVEVTGLHKHILVEEAKEALYVV